MGVRNPGMALSNGKRLLTCGVGFGLQLVDDVFVGAGAGDPGVLGELRLHGQADPLLAQKPLQFLKRLQARNINTIYVLITRLQARI